MWHVETDFFALAVFLIMFIKEFAMRKTRKERQEAGIAKRDIQSDAFYYVLILSIISVLIDIISSIVMNHGINWLLYEITMTIYVASMPLLAAVWVGYTYILIHQNYSLRKLTNQIGLLMIPYAIYIIAALSNPFTGLFFKLSKTMEYERGILFMPVGVGFIMLYSFIGLFLVFFYWKKINIRFNVFLLSSFFAITAVFTWVQLLHPGWLIINAGYAVIYVWCDITIEDRRRNELYHQISLKNKELHITAKKAEAAAEAKTEFLSRMSHDIRTPMNAIIGLTSLAKDADNLDTVRDYLNKMDSSSKFLLGLINDILDFSKIQNDEMMLHEVAFTCEEFENSIQTVIKPLIDEKEVNFIFQMNSDVDCIVADKLRFNQIFFNLLSNAVKFTPRGGTIEFISERIENESADRDGKVGLRMIVRDNGIGMSEEFQKRMYDPFLQEKSDLGDRVRGTGLGLPIVKSLVNAMGGTIEVKSALGEGTEFKVELYVKVIDAPDKEQEISIDKDVLSGLHILLVDDNELNAEIAQLLLEAEGAEIVVAANGKEAVDMFEASKNGEMDAILMDMMMPVMDGLTAAKCIRMSKRKDAKTIPIIAMTANAFREDVEKCLDAGMNGHVAKPIDMERIKDELEKYCRR